MYYGKKRSYSSSISPAGLSLPPSLYAKRQRLARARGMQRKYGYGPYSRKTGPYTLSSTSPEKKWFDTTIVDTTSRIAGVIYNLNLVPQGTNDQQRIGNKITIRNINIHAYANNDDALLGVPQGGNLRVIVYLDKQCNGATPLITDILKTASIESFRNMDNVDRFVFLKEKYVYVPIMTANAAHTDTTPHKWTVSVSCNIPIHFNSNTGAIAEIRSNNIGLLYITDVVGVNAAADGVCRVKFLDD